MTELTPKQENFVQYLAQGMSQRKAYRAAYNAENMSDNTVDNKACKLFAQEKIRTRYKEIMSELADTTILSVKERITLLYNLILKDDTKPTDKIKAIETINKMEGLYTTKIEADVNSSANVNVYKNLTEEQLIKLAEGLE